MTATDDRASLTTRAAMASIAMAVFLVGLKTWASIQTGSMAMLGSLADSGARSARQPGRARRRKDCGPAGRQRSPLRARQGRSACGARAGHPDLALGNFYRRPFGRSPAGRSPDSGSRAWHRRVGRRDRLHHRPHHLPAIRGPKDGVAGDFDRPPALRIRPVAEFVGDRGADLSINMPDLAGARRGVRAV